MAKVNLKKKQNLASSFKSKLALQLHGKNRTLFLIELVCIVAALVLISFLAIYWGGNGFSTADNILGEKGDFLIRIDTPTPGSEFSQGNNIYIRGGSLGGTLTKVIVWDTQYNVGAPCAVAGTQFSYCIFPNHISLGKHTIAIQAQNANGEWSQIAYTDIIIQSGGLINREFPSVPPSTIPNMFQPIIDIWNGITMHTEQGTGDNDLNGDNVDDRLQTSPFTPRNNPFNLPVTMIIIVVMILIIIIVLVFLFMKYLKQRNEYKSQMAKYIAADPSRRDWYLRLKSITAKTEASSSISRKLRFLKKKEEGIIQKQRGLRPVQTRPRFGFASIGRSIQNRMAGLQYRQQNIRMAHQARIRESQLTQQLNSVRHNMALMQLENNKASLQNKLIQLKRSDSLGGSNYKWFARKLASIQAHQQQLKEQHRREMEMERIQRDKERERFVNILNKLEKNKTDLTQQKSIKILIVPKESERPRVPYRPPQQRPVRQFIGMNNRGIAYGRRKKSKRKKARKVAL
jgi:uncharacterized membrane protein